MSEPNPNLDHLKTVLAEMAAETKELKAVAGGSITDVAADWPLTDEECKAIVAKLDDLDGL